MNETTPELKEVYEKMLVRHLDSMERINMDPDPFFEVRSVFQLGHQCYQELAAGQELLYRVWPAKPKPAVSEWLFDIEK